jgi:hypothetical protein
MESNSSKICQISTPWIPQTDLIIINDQVDDVDQRVANLFTKYSHRRNLSVMLIVENLFNRNKYHRSISLNTLYMVLFKTPETCHRSWR